MTAPIVRVTRSVISGPDTQAAIWFLGALSQPRVSGGQTGGAFALADHLARRGNASPVHVHNRITKRSSCSTANCGFSPARRNIPPGPAPSRCCPGVSVTPMSSPPPPRGSSPLHALAGFEQFATEVGEPARALTLPPPAGPPDFAALAQASARHQITILTPPPQP